MFFEKENIAINLKNVTSSRLERSRAITSNVSAGKIHRMNLTVCGDVATMVVDDNQVSKANFSLENYLGGFVSLVSNGTSKSAGGFKSFKIEAEDFSYAIDFEKIDDVNHLEKYFDSYYFENLEVSNTATAIPIADFWEINRHHHLSLNTAPIPCEKDFGNFAVLTFKARQFKDFTVTLEYQQSWERYGISFGTDSKQFPYTINSLHLCKPNRGSRAYVEAEGYRTIRGGLKKECTKPYNNMIRYTDKNSISDTAYYNSFMNQNFDSIRNYSHHRLVFLNKTNMSYTIGEKTYNTDDNTIIYIPAMLDFTQNGIISRSINILFDLYCEESNDFAVFTPENSEYYQNMFNQLYALWSQKEFGYKYSCTKLFYDIILRIQDELKHKEHKIIPAIIKPACDYIAKNYTDPNITVSLCAEICDISEVHFRNTFEEYYGISPKKYINNLRIKTAIALMKTQNYNVSEISQMAGFYNPKYFSLVFKKATGLSPSQYIDEIAY